MREYSRVEPKAWHGATFKLLRKNPKGLIVGLFLMTSPLSNMLGLYHQPLLYLAHETGLGIEGATEGLHHAMACGFCSYEEESEIVWVHEMARYQIGKEIKDKDNRSKGVQREYDALPDNPFLGQFYDRYGAVFHMTSRRGGTPPSKPLASQEHEQEQEQAHEQAQLKSTPTGVLVEPAAPAPPAAPAKPKKSKAKPKPDPDEPHPDDAPEGDDATHTVPDGKPPLCPHTKVLRLWAELLPDLPRHTTWAGARKATLRVRWKEAARAEAEQGRPWTTEHDGLQYFAKLFRWIGKSKFMTGKAFRAAGDQRPPFEATLEWVLKAGNMAKIIDGNYHKE